MANRTKAHDLEQVRMLQHGEHCYIHWAEEGGGEVHRIHDTFLLFEVPQYGGEPRFHAAYSLYHLTTLVDTAYYWT